MFYLFNGTYNGKPVNNTFMDDPPAEYGKHALFWGAVKQPVLSNTAYWVVIFTTVNYLRKHMVDCIKETHQTLYLQELREDELHFSLFLMSVASLFVCYTN